MDNSFPIPFYSSTVEVEVEVEVFKFEFSAPLEPDVEGFVDASGPYC